MRFTETPFDSPFKSAQAPSQVRDPVTTGSIGQVSSAPLQPVASAPLVRAQPLPPPQSSVALSSPAPQAVSGGAAGWSAQGGTPVVLAQGETLDTISSRYGVPRAAIMSANGLSNANVAPGTRITIPVYNASASAAPAAPAPVRQIAQAPAETQRFVAGPSAAPRVTPPAAVDPKAQARAAAEAKATAAAEAKAKAAADAQAMKESRARFAAEAKAKADARKTSAALPTPAAKPAAAPVAAVKPAPEAKPVKTAAPAAKPVVVASAPAAEPKPTAIPKAEPAPEPKTTASIPKQEEEASPGDKADFRWPARGRVISGYSGKGGNEGINIAVPEGTPVKAAEGGTVAYAGSELKGYGNLVLIRHPNGYVSAYAHNGELKVKRGDTVKRGQVVANSGQTGNVSSPQLHFELRKGSAPVDPTPYLNN
ncbi:MULTISPECIES: LysM peptidoglycan-binding domain-containing M23 family metallopeptidase [Bosea]|uniref:LysM peptidoglycan-binding domain-containing M23 family metallopeptidase n=1 Tax=Bosea TaxID=85413 RepID=UPI0027E25A95|nr:MULTISPECIES: LysM peptidoglycan-binding domain-containing M23 family metallopeptidase [Bosea]MDR6827425.1 murein DD-endopeptidase MepM/ murein hydrolase activator NlpD [Bosea robiniae]MDR6894135.1 murein DD-endopeptidase MepM/ murein hydrolase activator NlpD [Bosea sp. BE109]MDR7137530.1 murein DD-endopeptidase MepM/ murein hydrolase activator NlpD [Bosea sp. BE168]MDR7174230.1 murein DD-endopeptidase MepM/ murein hydrolase activator NlpD [Bosea sp. BE271]